MNKQKKRRYTKRLAITIKVKVYRIDKDNTHILDAYLLETKDMAQKGFFLKTQKVFPKNTKVKIELILSAEQPAIAAEGKVAWLARRNQRSYYPGMGIAIVKMAKDDKRWLRNFLKSKFLSYRHALELKSMYLKLKDMAARLYEMEESHSQAEHFRTVIDNAVRQINNIAHVLDKEVWEVKSL